MRTQKQSAQREFRQTARRTDDPRLRNGYRPEERLGSMNRGVELHTYRMGGQQHRVADLLKLVPGSMERADRRTDLG